MNRALPMLLIASLLTVCGPAPQAPCATAPAPVAQAIAASCTGERATGFASGDLRGAFWAGLPDTKDATP